MREWSTLPDMVDLARLQREQIAQQLAGITPQQREALLAVAERVYAQRALERYKPYAKQATFHQLGANHQERLFLAGNQLGKTFSGASEIAMHLTGKYPKWWNGRRFDKPTHGWAAGQTGLSTRDAPQKNLLGPPANKEDWGTGAIPHIDLVSWALGRGVADSVDQVVVKHVSGGQSILGFKSYDQGRIAWAGPTLDFVWYDEEPPTDIYNEGLARLTATGGVALITATPLLGMSDVIRQFYPHPTSVRRAVVRMEIEDAEHIPPERREEEIAKYPPHERDARSRGIPMLGSGRIFPVADSAIMCEPFAIPDFFACMGGFDFGWEHPTAAVKLAHDREDDIVYVTNAYRQAQQTPTMHAAAVRPWGGHIQQQWMPWAYPADAEIADKGSGKPLAEQYREQGLRLLPEPAAFREGGRGVEAGLMAMLDRMQQGRFRVFAHLEQWFEEFRNYHRVDGKVVKQHDDLMDATRYALMMIHLAKTKSETLVKRQRVWQRDTGYSI